MHFDRTLTDSYFLIRLQRQRLAAMALDEAAKKLVSSAEAMRLGTTLEEAARLISGEFESLVNNHAVLTLAATAGAPSSPVSQGSSATSTQVGRVLVAATKHNVSTRALQGILSASESPVRAHAVAKCRKGVLEQMNRFEAFIRTRYCGGSRVVRGRCECAQRGQCACGTRGGDGTSIRD